MMVRTACDRTWAEWWHDLTRTRKGRPRILHGLDASQRNVVMRASPNVNTPRKPLWMDALDT